GAARALGHPAVMLGVPESSGLGCGVSGSIERVRAIGPSYLLDLRVGERTIEVRWEWYVNPPALDEIISIAVTPDTLRFFNERNVRRSAGSPFGQPTAALGAREGVEEQQEDAAAADAEGQDERADSSDERPVESAIAASEESETLDAAPGAEATPPDSAPAFTPSQGLM